jgi:hypothetical protein
MSFVSNKLDNCVYIKKSGSKFVIFSLCVDDILLTENDVKNELSRKFEMKDMREASYVFGIQILRDKKYKMLSLN